MAGLRSSRRGRRWRTHRCRPRRHPVDRPDRRALPGRRGTQVRMTIQARRVLRARLLRQEGHRVPAGIQGRKLIPGRKDIRGRRNTRCRRDIQGLSSTRCRRGIPPARVMRSLLGARGSRARATRGGPRSSDRATGRPTARRLLLLLLLVSRPKASGRRPTSGTGRRPGLASGASGHDGWCPQVAPR